MQSFEAACVPKTTFLSVSDVTLRGHASFWFGHWNAEDEAWFRTQIPLPVRPVRHSLLRFHPIA